MEVGINISLLSYWENLLFTTFEKNFCFYLTLLIVIGTRFSNLMTSNVNANFATHEVALLVPARLAIVFRGTLLLKVGFLILILNVKISKDL